MSLTTRKNLTPHSDGAFTGAYGEALQTALDKIADIFNCSADATPVLNWGGRAINMNAGAGSGGGTLNMDGGAITNASTVNGVTLSDSSGVTTIAAQGEVLFEAPLITLWGSQDANITADGLGLNNGLGITISGGRIVSGITALTDAATITTNAALGNAFTVTLGDNRNMGAPSNALNGQVITYRITQDGTGSRTITWNAIFRFASGSAPTLSTAAGSVDYLTFIYTSASTKWDYVGNVLTVGSDGAAHLPTDVALIMHGGAIRMSGAELLMNTGDGTGGGILQMDGGDINNVDEISGVGGVLKVASSNLHMLAGSLNMNDGGGTGGDTLNMDGGIIDFTEEGQITNIGQISFATGGTLSGLSTLTLADGAVINFGATTGGQIGSTAAKKLGFWGATPIVRPVMATGTGKTVDNLITMLQAIGLCQQA